MKAKWLEERSAVVLPEHPRWRGNSSNTRVGGATRVSCHAWERAPSHSRYRALTGARSHATKPIKCEWLFDGTLQSRKHRDGGKGDRKAQAKRQAEKRRRAREAARVAACFPPKGKAGKPTKTWRIEMFERRRLRGKQTPMGVRRFARTTHEALQAAKKAASNALEQETLALARLKDVTAFATKTRDALRAARQEASVASNELKAAKQEASGGGGTERGT